MADIDLQEQTRRDDMFINISNTLDSLKKLDVFPSLVWLWCWDVIVNWYENEQYEDVHQESFVDECFAPGLELKTIWDRFWEEADKNGFSLEYGVEDLDEALRDWLREKDFIISLDEDNWLNEPVSDHETN